IEIYTDGSFYSSRGVDHDNIESIIDFEVTNLLIKFATGSISPCGFDGSVEITNSHSIPATLVGDRWSNPISNFSDFSGGTFEIFKARSQLSAPVYHSIKSFFTATFQNSTSLKLTATLHNSTSLKLIAPITHGVSSKLIALIEMSSIVRSKLIAQLSHSVRMRGRLTSVTENKKDRVRGRLASVAEHEIEQANTVLVDVTKNLIKEI
ncbi:MAG: hypothetical protein KAG26_08455, partial [Methylococcales bacterium]|nr:hypothetical protein [Methylococcales bacterium]